MKTKLAIPLFIILAFALLTIHISNVKAETNPSSIPYTAFNDPQFTDYDTTTNIVRVQMNFSTLTRSGDDGLALEFDLTGDESTETGIYVWYNQSGNSKWYVEIDITHLYVTSWVYSYLDSIPDNITLIMAADYSTETVYVQNVPQVFSNDSTGITEFYSILHAYSNTWNVSMFTGGQVDLTYNFYTAPKTWNNPEFWLLKLHTLSWFYPETWKINVYNYTWFLTETWQTSIRNFKWVLSEAWQTLSHSLTWFQTEFWKQNLHVPNWFYPETWIQTLKNSSFINVENWLAQLRKSAWMQTEHWFSNLISTLESDVETALELAAVAMIFAIVAIALSVSNMTHKNKEGR